MKHNLEKIKQFIEKHDELFFIIIFFIIIFGISIYIKTDPTDEVWNFQNIYKIYNGYKIYIDANVIITPLFPFIGVIIFKLFGANFFIFKLYGIFINLMLIFGVYKIFKSLEIPKWLSLFFTNILFISEINIFHNTTSYNCLCLIWIIFGLLIILNRNKYKNNKFIIIESIIIFLIFFTKQNIGVYYFLGFIIYNFIYEEKKDKVNNILKILLINIFFSIIFLIIFYKYGILDGFVSYAILGIKEFANNNFGVDNLILKFIGIIIINIMLVVFLNRSKNSDKKIVKNVNIISIFAFPLLLISYPIFNVFHIDISLFIMYILLIYNIYVIFLEVGFNKKIINRMNIILIIVLIIISMIKTYFYFHEIDYSYEYSNIYFGTLLKEEYKVKIEKVVDYIKKSDENVIVFSSESALYMMPLNISNGSMDEPLLGNFGKDGENGIIEKISKMKNTKIMINKEKKLYQESDKILQYIKDNLIYIGEIEDLLIYRTKN